MRKTRPAAANYAGKIGYGLATRSNPLPTDLFPQHLVQDLCGQNPSFVFEWTLRDQDGIQNRRSTSLSSPVLFCFGYGSQRCNSYIERVGYREHVRVV